MKTEKTVRKTTWYVPINRWTGLMAILISGMIWCPLVMGFAIKHPVRAAYLYGKMCIGYTRAYSDAQGVIVRTSRKVLPKGFRSAYKRYGVDAGHAMASEVSGKYLGTAPKSVGDKLVENGGILRFFGG